MPLLLTENPGRFHIIIKDRLGNACEMLKCHLMALQQRSGTHRIGKIDKGTAAIAKNHDKGIDAFPLTAGVAPSSPFVPDSPAHSQSELQLAAVSLFSL
jgi:hypothetical protein